LPNRYYVLRPDNHIPEDIQVVIVPSLEKAKIVRSLIQAREKRPLVLLKPTKIYHKSFLYEARFNGVDAIIVYPDAKAFYVEANIRNSSN
jgi:hypothetical protein